MVARAWLNSFQSEMYSCLHTKANNVVLPKYGQCIKFKRCIKCKLGVVMAELYYLMESAETTKVQESRTCK